MKKFMRLKIDNTEKSNMSSPNNLPDPPMSSLLEPCIRSLSEQSIADKLEPASDAPENTIGTVHENSNHDIYMSGTSDESPDVKYTPEEHIKADKNSDKDLSATKSTIMCRDFVRGTCKRPGTCKYAHKCDTSQLFGVYTFCRNYQNKVCTLPNCKYVHASIFEEQNFYRTGKLPPHVLAPKCPLPPPPPPPPPSGITETRVEIPTSFANPPPPLPMSVDSNVSMYTCVPTTSLEPKTFTEEVEGTATTSRNSIVESLSKMCKLCNIMAIRFRYQYGTMEKKRQSINDYKRQIQDIELKKQKITATVLSLLKRDQNVSALLNPMVNSVGDDINKILLDQLTQSMNINRLSLKNEDNSSKALLNDKTRFEEGVGMMNLLTKMITEYQHEKQGDVGRKD